MKIRGIIVPLLTKNQIESLNNTKINKGLRYEMCKKAVTSVACTDCLYSIDNHNVFLKTATKYWSKS